jgi:hypothetical protein
MALSRMCCCNSSLQGVRMQCAVSHLLALLPGAPWLHGHGVRVQYAFGYTVEMMLRYIIKRSASGHECTV